MSHLHLGPSMSILRGHFVAFPVRSYRLKRESHRDYNSLFETYKESFLYRKLLIKHIYQVKFTVRYRYIYHARMIESTDIPNLPGYVSIKEAADLLGVSDKRVYQYIRAGRLPAQRVGHILILPIEAVRQFKPGPSGRVRTKAPSWRAYRSRGTLFVTDIHVPVRAGQQAALLKKMRTIQKLDEHTFPGTVARYVVKSDEPLTALQILLVWKSTEMPDEAARKHDLELFQEELADMLEWETAQYSTNEVLIHT